MTTLIAGFVISGSILTAITGLGIAIYLAFFGDRS